MKKRHYIYLFVSLFVLVAIIYQTSHIFSYELDLIGEINGAGDSSVFIFYQVHTPTFEANIPSSVADCQIAIYRKIESLISEGQISGVYFEGIPHNIDLRNYTSNFKGLDSTFVEDFKEYSDSEIRDLFYQSEVNNVLYMTSIAHLDDYSIDFAGWEDINYQEEHLAFVQLYEEFQKYEEKEVLSIEEQERRDALFDELNDLEEYFMEQRSKNAYFTSKDMFDSWFQDNSNAAKGYAIVIGSGHEEEMRGLALEGVLEEGYPTHYFWSC